MAGITDYINDITKKFQFLKWIQIVPQESLATKKSALYFVEKTSSVVDIIIIDDLGQKRKASGIGLSAYQSWLSLGNTGSVIDFIKDVTYLNSMKLSIIDGELIIEDYAGDTAELIDGELILNKEF